MTTIRHYLKVALEAAGVLARCEPAELAEIDDDVARWNDTAGRAHRLEAQIEKLEARVALLEEVNWPAPSGISPGAVPR